MGVAMAGHADLLVTTLPDLPGKKKTMPLTVKGQSILATMKKQYGKIRGKRVFYASQQKGTIKGTHKKRKKH